MLTATSAAKIRIILRIRNKFNNNSELQEEDTGYLPHFLVLFLGPLELQVMRCGLNTAVFITVSHYCRIGGLEMKAHTTHAHARVVAGAGRDQLFP